MNKKKDELIVRKSNNLIQNFKFSLSKTEIRIVNFIIANIKSPLYSDEFNTIKFHITDFYKLLNIDNPSGKEYEYIKKIIRGLKNKTSDWVEIGDYETIVSWIEKPKFYPKSGTIELKLDDDLKPLLLKMNGYMAAQLNYYFEMDSKYSMRLYELLRSYDGFKSKEFEVDELRASIDALKKAYDGFGKFRQAILDPAVEEINKFTDLTISYETRTRGRKVTHVVFLIKKDKSNKDKSENKAENQHTENIPISPEPQLPDTEFKEQQTNLFNVAKEGKYSKENEFYAEAMSNAFTDEQVTELVKIAKAKIVKNPLFKLNYQDEMKIYHYIEHYYQTLKMTDIKSTPYHTLRNKLLHDYEGVIE